MENVHSPVRRWTSQSPQSQMCLAFLVDLGLVLLDPERLRKPPLGGDGPVAVVLEGVVVRTGDPVGLVGGAYVHPHDGRPQVTALVVDREHGAAHGVHRDARDLLCGHATLFHRGPYRPHERRPPLVRVLLGPPRTRVLQRELPLGKDDRRPFGIEDADPGSTRPEVDAHEVRTLGHCYAPSSQPNSSHRSGGMSWSILSRV